MNDEVAFLAALFAQPDDRTTLLVFADWLDERGEHDRARALRLLAAPEPDWKRIADLSSFVPDIRKWVVRLKCGRGSPVRLTGGAFDGYAGQVVGIYPNNPDKIVVAVRIVFLGLTLDTEVDSTLVKSAVPYTD